LTTLLAVAHDHQVTDRQHRSPRDVALLTFDGVQTLDLAGPLEVFTGANRGEGVP